MTVLVGIYCTDGVVIGADSSATFTHGLTPIMEQPTRAKIATIGDKAIVATSGPIGLGQRFAHHVDQEWGNGGFSEDPHAVSTRLSGTTLKDFQASGVPRHPQLGWNFGALLAAPIDHKAYLIEYDSVAFQPERKTEDLRFVTTGSGQLLADPFLGFLRRTFWQNSPPNLQEGIFCALWTLRHTIELNPGGVGGDAHIAVLARERKQQWGGRILSADELSEHEAHCDSIERHLESYRPHILGKAGGVSGTNVPDVPRPAP